MAKKDKSQDRFALSLSRDMLSKINNEKKFKVTGGQFFYNLKDNQEIGVPQWYVSTGSTALDLAMSGKVEGGIPSGTIIELFGLKQSGKSLIGLTICREVQKAGGVAVYIDAEQRFFRAFANAIGVDTETSTFMYSDIPFLESVLESIQYINREYRIAQLKNKDKKIPLVFIWDSLHASNPKDDYEEDDYGLGGYKTQKARLLSQHLHKINYEISKSGASLVILNQLRTNVGAMVGEKYVTTGGMTVEYYASLRLKLQSYKQFKESGEELGRIMKATVVKNSVYRPNLTAEFIVRYDSGIDKLQEWYNILKSEKLISVNGSWSSFNFPDPNTGEPLDFKFYSKDFKEKMEEYGLEDFIKSKVVESMRFEYARQESELEEEQPKNINDEEE